MMAWPKRNEEEVLARLAAVKEAVAHVGLAIGGLLVAMAKVLVAEAAEWPDRAETNLALARSAACLGHHFAEWGLSIVTPVERLAFARPLEIWGVER